MAASYLKIAGDLTGDAILASVEVEQELNQHWWCRVACRQTGDERFPIEDSLGKDLQVIAVDQAEAEHVIFDGFVLEARLVYEVFGSYTVRLVGVTRSYKLELTPQEAYFRKKTLPDIASELASTDGLQADVKCPARPPKNYVQWGEPDFAFLRRLADDHGCWLRPTAAGIQISDAYQPGTKLQWRDEDGLLTFRVKGKLAPASFNGTHYNARKMESTRFEWVKKDAEFFGSSAPMVDAVKQQSQAKLPPGYSFLDRRAATADEYREVLEHESVRGMGAAVVATGTSRNEALLPGNRVEIEGSLDAAGAYGVTRVVHRWTAAGYVNEFSCTPWKAHLNAVPPGGKLMGGVVPARVTDNKDPRKMGRVKVQYDWQEQGDTGWARMLTPYAGADRGFMFMPEVGDEVLVAFEHGDMERPYVVGSLWNGVDQAPREEFWGGDIEANDVKRIVTKSGHRIQLSDKPSKEAITIATPNVLKISLLEKADETGRSMVLLHSADGDMFISAPSGRVHFRSKYFSREVSGPVVLASASALAATTSPHKKRVSRTSVTSSGPPYEPGRWNQQPVKGSTNCYAYAANDPDGHPPGKPQPGEHCGRPVKDVTCAEVSRASICDGMTAAPDPPEAKPGYYPVALVVDPGVDYHWYRLDDSGRWSHKPGNTNATNVDASGKPITNPKAADRNYGSINYSKFCGYFYVPASGIRTGPP